MSAREKVMEFTKIHGPVMPIQIAKEINSSTLIASAYLSELVSAKELKISHLKIGDSPLYYAPGQEASLQKFSDKLHEKEKRVYDLLKAKKVLEENELDPVVRVIIKNIKDFAVPLQVNYKDKSEIFWKWYLTTNEEAEKLIKEILTGKVGADMPKEQEKAASHPEEKQEQLAKEPTPQPAQQPLVKEARKEPIEQKKERKEPKTQPSDSFYKSIMNYFAKNNIRIKEETIIRKSSEIEFVIELPSAVGNLTYYCKAKSKQKLNEGDLSAAFIMGQSKKLPVLLLAKGELTKRAEEMLEKEFKGMGVRKI